MNNQGQPQSQSPLYTEHSRGEMTAAEMKKAKDIFKVLNVCKLSRKTEEFVESLESQLNEKGFLSKRQYEALLDVYERA